MIREENNITVFVILLAVFAFLSLLSVLGISGLTSTKAKGRIAIGIMFIFAGVLHFIATERFMMFMPPFLPWHRELVYLSGICEVAGGIGLFIPARQRLAAYGLVALLIAVFPANIYVAIANVPLGGYMSSPLYQWLRLPFQFVLIWWALWCTSGESVTATRKAETAVVPPHERVFDAARH